MKLGIVLLGSSSAAVAAAAATTVATPRARLSLRFDGSATNAFGGQGQWLVERARGATDATTLPLAADFRAVPAAEALRIPLRLPLPCAADDPVAFDREVRVFITNGFARNRFAPRHISRRCGTGARCGRVVLDGIFDEEELRELEQHGPQRWGGLGELRQLISEHFGVEASRLMATGGQLDSNVQSDLPCQMHVDFQSKPDQYYFTSIVYLSEQRAVMAAESESELQSVRRRRPQRASPSRPVCVDCETVFLDAVEPLSGRATRGLAVEPRRGRIVLFSGGAENLHCKVPSAGDRVVAQVFFRCAASGEL